MYSVDILMMPKIFFGAHQFASCFLREEKKWKCFFLKKYDLFYKVKIKSLLIYSIVLKHFLRHVSDKHV